MFNLIFPSLGISLISPIDLHRISLCGVLHDSSISGKSPVFISNLSCQGISLVSLVTIGILDIMSKILLSVPFSHVIFG